MPVRCDRRPWGEGRAPQEMFQNTSAELSVWFSEWKSSLFIGGEPKALNAENKHVLVHCDVGSHVLERNLMMVCVSHLYLSWVARVSWEK